MNYRQTILKNGYIISLLLFFVGLIASKALISIGSVGIILCGFGSFRANKVSKDLQIPLLTGFGLLVLMPLVSGIWSQNTGAWVDSIANKIMLPLLAMGFIWSPKLDSKEIYYLSLFQLVSVWIATLYSIGAYVYSPVDINKTYLVAKTLPVLLNNDHLHFSLYVFISLFLVYSNRKLYSQLASRSVKFMIVGIVTWFVIYLHILGAKTGILFLYIGVGLLFFSNDFINISFFKKITIIPVLVLVLMAAYYFIPSFYNRFHYTRYDFNHYIHGQYVNGLTDGARVLSWKAGAEIAKLNPVLGIGFGDMNDTFMKWHEVHSSHLDKYNWLQPSNEWLMYWCGAGMLGMLTLSLGLSLTYFKSAFKGSISFFILFICQVLMMWYEVNLNNQIGISLFVFSLCSFQLYDYSKPIKITHSSPKS